LQHHQLLDPLRCFGNAAGERLSWPPGHRHLLMIWIEAQLERERALLKFIRGAAQPTIA
jgi:hypothetical protein